MDHLLSRATALPIIRIKNNLKIETGHDFSNYKTATLSRRLTWRMAVHQPSSFSDYVKHMGKDPA